MTVFLQLFVSLVIWGIVWRFTAKYWRKKGWGPAISHVCAGLSGFVTAILILALLAPAHENEVGSTARENEKNPSKESMQRRETGASNSAALTELPQTFTGVPSTETQWPTLASITVPVSNDEREFLHDMACLDETECYGEKRFERYIMGTYPDLKKIKFVRPNEVANDDEGTVSMLRQQFVQGLYFAKRIKLANGQSLFDFMQSCSGGFRENDSAESSYDSKNDSNYFTLQYFVALRKKSNGDPVELTLTFDRRGNQIIANSPFFSSNVLRYADFLARHNVKCATADRL
ncbi:hypothetical protein PQR66_38600 [Paraburkholderia agricolaris]|uniref:Uncharacterized protein n=1 Tax=Paraburkholderia agricolaris TaxID=2152888 RepID=A0ABW9A1J7_9BURK